MFRGISIFLLFGSCILFLNPFFNGAKNFAFAKNSINSTPYIVVIDAGHGGADGGAQGRVGKQIIYEKDMALGIAVRLAKVLNERKYWSPLGRRIKVILTRKKDVDVSLEERSRIAHENKADLFVSIHMNSDPKAQASGIETYFLNNTDSKSSDKLAEIENKPSKHYAKGVPESLLLKSVTIDAATESSRAAANFIHKSLAERFDQEEFQVKNRGVKQALLYVLLDAEVPAVLCETLFISNKRDAQFVSTGENRQKIAEGLAFGILRFLATR